MFNFKSEEKRGHWLVELLPAFLTFSFSIVFALYLGSHAASDPWRVFYRTFLRFFRYTLFLCLPLYFLRPIYHFILGKGKEALIQIDHPVEVTSHLFKNWLFRPFQGIGIGFLFATKLISVIETIAGPLTSSSSSIIASHYQLGRMLLVIAITIIISLLLSTLWTLDDMGIRYYNRRDQELKMIGKYVGTLMPLIFGLYGLFSLLAHYPRGSILLHVFRIILAFYPPLVVFVIVHSHFINWKADFLARKNLLKKGGIWQS